MKQKVMRAEVKFLQADSLYNHTSQNTASKIFCISCYILLKLLAILQIQISDHVRGQKRYYQPVAKEHFAVART
jgi:hypothetical protein